tara:strand:- start:59 stop:445 length:387 start_codon:yes stop_codon:yes gene_type:complete
LIWENEAEFKAIYERYIYATHCELCQKVFPNTRDRQMDHQHLHGKYGPFRNVVCNKCNLRKADTEMRSNNKSGHKGIYWDKSKNAWRFQAMVIGEDGKSKQKYIKQMKDLDELIAFADQWKIDNNYHT